MNQESDGYDKEATTASQYLDNIVAEESNRVNEDDYMDDDEEFEGEGGGGGGGRKKSKKDEEMDTAAMYLSANLDAVNKHKAQKELGSGSSSDADEYDDEDEGETIEGSSEDYSMSDADMPDLDEVSLHRNRHKRRGKGGRSKSSESSETDDAYFDKLAKRMTTMHDDMIKVYEAIAAERLHPGLYPFIDTKMAQRVWDMKPKQLHRLTLMIDTYDVAENTMNSLRHGGQLVKGGMVITAQIIEKIFAKRGVDLTGYSGGLSRKLVRHEKELVNVYRTYIKPYLEQLTGGKSSTVSDLMALVSLMYEEGVERYNINSKKIVKPDPAALQQRVEQAVTHEIGAPPSSSTPVMQNGAPVRRRTDDQQLPASKFIPTMPQNVSHGTVLNKTDQGALSEWSRIQSEIASGVKAPEGGGFV